MWVMGEALLSSQASTPQQMVLPHAPLVDCSSVSVQCRAMGLMMSEDLRLPVHRGEEPAGVEDQISLIFQVPHT